jgi:RNA polymerase sigma factor FliA
MPKHRRSLCSENRQRLILENLTEVHYIARRIHTRLPPHVQFDDLVHSGVLGLIEAVENFDPAKNVAFQAYSQFRIRGAILDSLRELDWSPRSLRRQARRIENAHSELTARLGRVPSEPEVADYLGFRLDKYQHILTQLHSLAVGARQEPLEITSQEEGRVAPSNRASEDPFQSCVRAEAIRMLTDAVDTLSEIERETLVLYYFEERTMKEVGRILDIHESSVSRIIGVALDRLRARLSARGSVFRTTDDASRVNRSVAMPFVSRGLRPTIRSCEPARPGT